MLVLSRRPNERIVLPDVGISIEVLSVRGNTVKIGVEAPVDIRILRGELARDAQPPQSPNLPAQRKTHLLSRDEFHDLKNRLNGVSLALQLLRKQRLAGRQAEAEATLNLLLRDLDREILPQSPPDAVEADYTALLVEDDDNERELLAGLLRMSGYTVLTARDGLEALEYLNSQAAPNVVLLDMRMPRCDGPATIGMIRANPALRELPVYAVSATDPSELGVRTGLGGVDGWFAKPLNPEILTREIGQFSNANASA